MNEIQKNISISHSVWTFPLKLGGQFTGVFLSLNVLCPLLITCWWLALDAFRFIINSLDGESEDVHKENKSVDISPSFSAVERSALARQSHFLWQQPSVLRFVCIGQGSKVEKEGSGNWEFSKSAVSHTGFFLLCLSPWFMPKSFTSVCWWVEEHTKSHCFFRSEQTAICVMYLIKQNFCNHKQLMMSCFFYLSAAVLGRTYLVMRYNNGITFLVRIWKFINYNNYSNPSNCQSSAPPSQ